MTSQTDLLYVYTALSQTTFVSRRPCRRSFIADANSMASVERRREHLLQWRAARPIKIDLRRRHADQSKPVGQ